MTTPAGPTSANQLDPGAVISRTLDVYKSQAGTLLGAAVVVFAVEAILTILLGPIGSLVNIIVSYFYTGMVVRLVQDIQDGTRDTSLGDLFSSVTPVILPLIAVSIIAGIGIAIGLILIIVPGLFLMTIWAVVAPVTVVEKPGVFAAFGRSQQLVKGNGWQVFGLIIIVLVISVGIGVIIGLIAAAASTVVRAIISWGVNIVVAPLAALITATLYFALRAIHGEGPGPSTVASDTGGLGSPSSPAPASGGPESPPDTSGSTPPPGSGL